MPIEVRRVRAAEATPYREIRLRALVDAPHAFGTTWAEAAARPPGWWDARVAATAAGDASALFVAVSDRGWIGLLGGERVGRTVEVISMWVDPARRRAGIGRLLLDAVTSWAAQHGAVEARLSVTEDNAPALALYHAYGFTLTGESEPHPRHAGVRELAMRRAL